MIGAFIISASPTFSILITPYHMNGFYNFISYEYFRYEYSHIKDRLWRKTRSNHLKTRCVGVDPNRNWGHNWGKLILNKKLGGST